MCAVARRRGAGEKACSPPGTWLPSAFVTSHPSPLRCPTHGLACGPDGQCVLCHRSAPAPAGGATNRAVIGGLVALSIALVGAVGWRTARDLARLVQERVAAARAAETAEAPKNPIRLYTTSWCPHCARAKQWLNAAHVEYAELDVERNAWARRENVRLNGRGSVPTLDADGEVVKGFSAEEFRAALDRAAAHGAP